MTRVSISGEEILINGTPTYQNREFEGKRIQGLLFNVRAVQAIFDDINPETRENWNYPDTGVWDPDRNTKEFCDALSIWKKRGVLAITINFQGGGALYHPEVYDHFVNNGFTTDGLLKQAYADRLAKVLKRADELGMVVIAGIFYRVFAHKMKNEQAVWDAARNALNFLHQAGHKNLLIEVANESGVWFGHDLFLPNRIHEMVRELKKAYPQFFFSSSVIGGDADSGWFPGMPSNDLIKNSDYVLLHGNRLSAEQLENKIKAFKEIPEFRDNPKPIIINEDTTGIPNLEAAWRNGVSWGYYDQGFGGVGGFAVDHYVDFRSQPRENNYDDLSGFQTPPINWGINTDLKRAFFDRVSEITGAGDGDS